MRETATISWRAKGVEIIELRQYRSRGEDHVFIIELSPQNNTRPFIA